MRGSRKGMLIAASAGAAVLLLASPAFACTTFKGQGTVTNTDTVNNPGTSTVKGNNSGMGYCAGYPVGGANAQAGDTVTVSVAPNPSGSCNTSQLAANNYQVNFVNFEKTKVRGAIVMKPGFAISGSTYTWKSDCMSTNANGIVNISGGFTFAVNSAGAGSGTYTIPTSTGAGAVVANTAGTDASAICVADSGAFTGLQIPLAIVV